MTVLVGTALFVMLGRDPLRGLQMFFVEPLSSLYALSELSVKATPLILIALGLAVCFRSNVWNIGAEGQFIVGALCAGWVAMQAGPAGPLPAAWARPSWCRCCWPGCWAACCGRPSWLCCATASMPTRFSSA